MRVLAPVLTLLTVLPLAAQRGAMAPPPPPPPPPPQLLPVIDPPVDHPAYLGQPLMQKGVNDARAAEEAVPPGRMRGHGKAAGPDKGAAPAAPPVRGPGVIPLGRMDRMDPEERTAEERAADEFRSSRVAGKEVRKGVGAVLKEFRWHEKLLDALAEGAATGKPILWVQMLGDLDGFA